MATKKNTTERNYSVNIKFSSKELTPVERVKFKDTTDVTKLDLATKDGDIIITPDMYVILDIYNEQAKGDKEYEQMIIVDKDGTKYMTGSSNFIDTFMNIAQELDGMEYELKIMSKPSKNYAGKTFLTCAVV